LLEVAAHPATPSTASTIKMYFIPFLTWPVFRASAELEFACSCSNATWCPDRGDSGMGIGYGL